jgi:uncharacterized membrane protein
MNMKTLLPLLTLTLLTLALLTSCMTPRRLKRFCANCPTQTTILSKDCTYIYRDTFEVQLPQDSTFLRLYLKCVNGQVVASREIKELGKLIDIEYKLIDSILQVKAFTIDTASILAAYEKTMQKKSTQERVVVQAEPESRWLIYTLCVLIAALIAVLIYAFRAITKLIASKSEY